MAKCKGGERRGRRNGHFLFPPLRTDQAPGEEKGEKRGITRVPSLLRSPVPTYTDKNSTNKQKVTLTY